MMNCRQATRLLSEAQDRPLTLKERAAWKLHVMICASCQNFGKQMKELRSFTRAYVKGNDDSDEM